jgi:hypothetical protein
VIADGHALPADSAEHQSLEKCRAFSRRAIAPVNTQRLRAFP